jgi:carbonic anhydrase
MKAICLLLPLLILSAMAGQEPHPTHWGYEAADGPIHWAELSSEFATCNTGHEQSPIDIRNAKKADLPPIQFAYKPSPLRIIDNGHTIQVNYAPGSSITAARKTYQLIQFHFHRPSEELINSKAYDMEVHLVHADPDGNLAVVAVLLRKSDSNPLLKTIFTHLPKEKGREQSSDTTIDLNQLLPADRAYYNFRGSLTTPPCSENVNWIVFVNPMSISASELESFIDLYKHNVRPIQPLNKRTISVSESETR